MMKTRWFLAGFILLAKLATAADLKDDNRAIADTPRAAEALSGKRLFFTESERVLSSGASSVVPDGKPIKEVWQLEPDPWSDVGQISESSDDEPLQLTESITVRYDARVENEQVVRLVINDVPCKRIDLPAAIAQQTNHKLDCPSLSDSDVQLILLADGKRIQVMHGARSVGILEPGQTL